MLLETRELAECLPPFRAHAALPVMQCPCARMLAQGALAISLRPAPAQNTESTAQAVKDTLHTLHRIIPCTRPQWGRETGCEKLLEGEEQNTHSLRSAADAPKHRAALSTSTASVPTSSLSLRAPQKACPARAWLPFFSLSVSPLCGTRQASKRNAPAGCSKRYDCIPQLQTFGSKTKKVLCILATQLRGTFLALSGPRPKRGTRYILVSYNRLPIYVQVA